MEAEQVVLMEQLQATNRTMQMALEAIADAVVFVDAERYIQWCNRAFEQLIEQKRDRIVGTSLIQLLPLQQNQQPIAPDLYPDIQIRNGDASTTQYELQQGDHCLVLEISGNCTDSALAEGNIVNDRTVVLIIRDITQQTQEKRDHIATTATLEKSLKQAEVDLKASETRLHTILSNTLASIERYHFDAHLNRKYQYCSPGSFQVWGYPPEEIIADVNLIPSRIHPEDWEQMFQPGLDHIFAEKPYKFEYRYFHPDGKERWISASLSSVRDEESEGWLVTITSIDITDRKQAEAALAESEAKFRAIVENANAVLATMTFEGILKYVSPNVSDLLGWTTTELVGQSFAPHIHPDSQDKCLEVLKKLITTGEKQFEIESRVQHKNGTWKWLLCSYSIFQDANGQSMIISVGHDISDRKQVEAALAESEAKFRLMVENANAVIAILTPTGIVRYTSSNVFDFLGYTPDEIQGQAFEPLIHPDDLPKCWSALSQVIETGVKQSAIEYRTKHKDSSWRWGLANFSLSQDINGELLIIAVSNDITERKQVEAALAESEAKFRAMVENANAVIAIQNRDGILRYTSSNVVDFIGYTPEEMEGRSFEPLIHPEDLPKCWSALTQLIEAGEKISGIEYRFKHKDGTWRWGVSNFSISQDVNGEILIITVANDITERKQIEEALKASETRLNTILSSALAAIFRLRVYANEEWEFEYCSAGCLQIWGYPPEVLIADKNTFLANFLPEDLEAIYKITFDAIFAEESCEVEYRYHHPDGSLRWISFSLTSVRDEATDSWIATAINQDITERKQAEEALKASESRMNMILNSVQAVIQYSRVYANGDWIYEYCSPGSLKIWGYPVEQVMAEKYLVPARIYPEDWQRIEQQVISNTLAENTCELEYRYNHPDGSLRWISLNVYSRKDQAADYWIVTAVSIDITERKQAEEKLRHNEALLAITQQISHVGSWEFDPGIGKITWSEETFRIHGFDPAQPEPSYAEFLATIHPEDREFFQEKVILGLTEKIPYKFDFRIFHPDDSIRYLEARGQVAVNEQGQVTKLFGAVADITERKYAEAALAESEAKFRSIVENANDSIFVLNSEGIVSYISPNVVNILGYTATEMEGKNFGQFVHPEDFAGTLDGVASVLSTGQRLSGFECRGKHKDGNWRWMISNLGTSQDTNGNPIIIGVSRDISDRKQFEEALKASEARLNSILDSTSAAIIHYRVYPGNRLEFEYFSAGSQQLYGYSPEELIADQNLFLSRVVAEDLSASYQPSIDAVYAGTSYEDEYRYCHPDGTIRWVSFKLSAVRDEVADCWIATSINTDVSDRKQAEEALKASEARLNMILNSALAGIYQIRVDANHEWEFQYCSPGCFQLWGCTREELMADKNCFLSKIVPEDLETIYNISFPAIFAEESCQVEYRYNHPDGSLRWISSHLSPVREADTNCWIVTVISPDITDRKRAESALQKSELKYRHLFENSQVGIGRTRWSDGIYLDANQRLVEILGLNSADELVGKRRSTEFYADLSERQQMMEQLQKYGEVRNFEVQIQRADKSVSWGLVSVRFNAEDKTMDFVVTDISDRKQAEAALKASETRLNTILSSTFAAITRVRVYRNRDWEIEYCSAGSLEIWGYAPEELIADKNHYVSRMVPEDLEANYRTGFDDIFAERTVEGEYRYHHPDQSLRWISYTGTSVRDEASDSWLLTMISTDISDRKRAEIALQASELKFRSIVESANHIIYILNLAGIFTYFSPNVFHFLGFTVAEMEGNSFINFAHPEDLEICYNAIQTITSQVEQLHNIEVRVRHKQGGWRWLSHNSSRIKSFEGEILILGVAYDITERKEAETALQVRAQRESLLSNISRHFIDQDANTAINYTLEAVAQYLSVERTCIFEYLGDKSHYSMIHEWCDPKIQPLFTLAKNTPISIMPWFHERILRGQIVQENTAKDFPIPPPKNSDYCQEERIQSVAAVPTLYGGEVVGFLGADVTTFAKQWTAEEINFLKLVAELIAMGRARYKAEAALKEAKEAAEAASRAKSTFLANMSHELRTPLNAILGFTQIMQRDRSLNSSQQEYLEIVNRSGEHLLTLINDVLEMSKIEAGRTTLNVSSFDLYYLLDSLKEMLQVRTNSKGLKLVFDKPSDLPQYIISDESKLRQVLINLLGNAVKFTAKGQVSLRMKVIQDTSLLAEEFKRVSAINQPPSVNQFHLLFAVEDTGPGIAPEEINNLFEKFVQTETGRKSQQGTGLGLAISRQFVRLMGGEITISSSLGQGTIFTFYIPVTLAQASQVQPRQTRSQRVIGLEPNQKTYRILVVEDIQENRTLLMKLLTSIGFEVNTATNGQEAIEVWSSFEPHLIWMDMRMPVMDGYEATKQIKATFKGQSTVIIALTASAFEENRATVLSAGCDDFVRKPFAEEIIFEKMALHLGVRYLYETDNVKADPQPTLPEANSEDAQQFNLDQALAQQPAAWITQLHQAARSVNANQILQLLTEIPDSEVNLVQAVTDLVNDFRFDILVELTEKSE